MTLPNERYRAIQYARDFLRALLDPKQTPRISKEIRLRARSVLKHFPTEFDMECVVDKDEDTFAKDED